MANFNLTWNNTPILSVTNVTGQKASQRISPNSNNSGATITWSTSGFNPINNIAKNVNNAVFVGLSNILYDIKIEGICTLNGPVIGVNTIKQNLVFECIPIVLKPISNITPSLIDFKMEGDFTNTDIFKIKYTLFKIEDAGNILIETSILNTNFGPITRSFFNIIPRSKYYVKYSLFSIIGGIEIESTLFSYGNLTCQSNIIETLDR